ncbi:unnamed protein product [Meganyctiphanes norvegica]|uniref:Peptidase S1 domain-containing protein n=1 Tax=Meganyctiphanes norvegica TaxID=48144 RepID=A0AAV2QEL3_MEGNR
MHKSFLLLGACVLGAALAVPRERRQALNSDADFIQACECVPYYQCQDGEIITDGAGLIDIRVGNRSAPAGAASPAVSTTCELFLDVCCRVPNVNPGPIGPPAYTAGCGRRNVEGIHARISGFQGNEAQFGEFPWMTAVLRTEYIGDKEVNLYVCGGSLIEDNVVLTAAHCVAGKDSTKLKIRVGEWDTQNEYETYAHEDRQVLEYIVHPAYNQQNLQNDFALVFLESPFILKPHIDTVCLPGPQPFPEGTTCFATGWGKDKFGKEGVYQNVLKKIDLPIVDNYNCQESLRTTRLGKYFKLDDSFMCAGGVPTKDTCTGDGGSPLVCQLPGDSSYVQVGIVAWGIGCGEDGVPGVYADVTQAGDWIENEIIYRRGV